MGGNEGGGRGGSDSAALSDEEENLKGATLGSRISSTSGVGSRNVCMVLGSASVVNVG